MVAARGGCYGKMAAKNDYGSKNDCGCPVRDRDEHGTKDAQLTQRLIILDAGVVPVICVPAHAMLSDALAAPVLHPLSAREKAALDASTAAMGSIPSGTGAAASAGVDWLGEQFVRASATRRHSGAVDLPDSPEREEDEEADGDLKDYFMSHVTSLAEARQYAYALEQRVEALAAPEPEDGAAAAARAPLDTAMLPVIIIPADRYSKYMKMWIVIDVRGVYVYDDPVFLDEDDLEGEPCEQAGRAIVPVGSTLHRDVRVKTGTR